MLYKITYITMLICYAYLSAQAPDVKGKIIGMLCFLLNGVLFWR